MPSASCRLRTVARKRASDAERDTARVPTDVPTEFDEIGVDGGTRGRHDRRMEILQVAQHADDLDRAAAFYELVLGSKPAARFDPPGLVFFNVGCSRLLLEQEAPSALVYLQVDDVVARVDELHVLGVEVIDEPRVIYSHTDDSLGPAGTDEWMAFIRDTEGNTVGLASFEPRHDP